MFSIFNELFLFSGRKCSTACRRWQCYSRILMHKGLSCEQLFPKQFHEIKLSSWCDNKKIVMMYNCDNFIKLPLMVIQKFCVKFRLMRRDTNWIWEPVWWWFCCWTTVVQGSTVIPWSLCMLPMELTRTKQVLLWCIRSSTWNLAADF